MNELTRRIIGCAFTVAKGLGCGFVEKVYENAMMHELAKCGMSVEQQCPVTVQYDGAIVGEYIADLIVERTVLVELKACKSLDDIHVAQCLNYLKATRLAACLLINFGKPRIEIKRLLGNAPVNSAIQ